MCADSAVLVVPAARAGRFVPVWAGLHRGLEKVAGGWNRASFGCGECKGGCGRAVQVVDRAWEGVGPAPLTQAMA